MLDASRLTQEWIADCTRGAFDGDKLLQSALTYQIQIIGEAASRIGKEDRRRFSGIPWDEVVGMRHVLVHDYMAVDADIVWEVATRQIPLLVEALEKALGVSEI